MTESKFKRLVVAITVGAVTLLCLLLIIMVYQLISIGVESSRIERGKALLQEYEEKIEKAENTLEERQTNRWLDMRARELGFSGKDDMIIEINGK